MIETLADFLPIHALRIGGTVGPKNRLNRNLQTSQICQLDRRTAGGETNMDAHSDNSGSELRHALALATSILATLREPFVVLDKNFWVQTANASFYRTFHVSSEETENRSFFELDNAQWNSPHLRKMLRQLSSAHLVHNEFEIEGVFPNIGKRVMSFHARRIDSHSETGSSDLILLRIEDVTEVWQTKENAGQEDAAWRKSEVQYRRLFESARDGILILNERSGKIIDANPFMCELLGFDLAYFMSNELWEIGLFADIAANQAAFRDLQAKGYIRYDVSRRSQVLPGIWPRRHFSFSSFGSRLNCIRVTTLPRDHRPWQRHSAC